MPRAIIPTIILTSALLLAAGCANLRRIIVTSEPAGARVFLNDQEIGVTPAEASFKFYGTYSVRLDKPGYEPIVTTRKASAPVHEWPGLDLVATVIPYRFTDRQQWHFDLTPALETQLDERDLEDGLRERAREVREQLESVPPRTAPSAADGPAAADGPSAAN